MPAARTKHTKTNDNDRSRSSRGCWTMGSQIGARSLDETEKLVLYSIGALECTPLRSKVKLQKLHFLLSRTFPDLEDLFEFEPHLLGPYSDVVESVLEDLMSLGLVQQTGSSYELTRSGQTVFAALHPTGELASVMEDFKEFLNDLPDDEILVFIYVFYPGYIGESAKWEALKGRRVDIAVSLLKKAKISFSKALELSGLPMGQFTALLRERGIRWRAV